MFEAGFPKALRDDVLMVEKYIPMKLYKNLGIGQSEQYCTYSLENGETISFPYRIYYMEDEIRISTHLTQIQKTIYHAIYSRSYDGFVREKHLKFLLDNDRYKWVYPYILKLSDEYVMEIVELIYEKLYLRDTTSLKKFCVLNLQQFLKGHDRMISYWNEFYRDRCYRYKEYVGRKLYKQCFGYSRSFEKLRDK